MILSLSLLERAEQGDAGAIAALMNDVLQTQEVWVKATLDRDCLQVMLKSPAVLNQATSIAFIRRGLLRLQPKAIKHVRAYAWQVGDAFPLWIATFSLEKDTLLSGQKAVGQLDGRVAEVVLAGDAQATQPSIQPATQSATQALTPSPTARQRPDLFKLGFVLVLMTMVYFVVIGV